MAQLFDFLSDKDKQGPDPPERFTPRAAPSVARLERVEYIKREAARTQHEMRRRHHRTAPCDWVQERLGYSLWTKEREILNSVCAHRRTLVRSCHEVGKSHTAGNVAAWWLDVWPVGEAFVVTSAPTAHQVKAILWREIARAHTAGKLNGRVTQTEWKMPVGDGSKEELVAFGRKPDEYDPDAFQGIHARRVLVIFDEANGIRGPLWDAADSLIANDLSKMLVIGNPDDPTGEFFENAKPGSDWHVVDINAFMSPNFTGEPMPVEVLDQLIGRRYVEERRKKWARRWIWVDAQKQPTTPEAGVEVICPDGIDPADTHPFWQSKVMGRFPQRSDAGGLIPVAWVERAQQQKLAPVGPNELGCDVGAGGDESTVAHRRGPVVRVIRSDRNPDTMETCGNLISDLKMTGAKTAKIDLIGIGRGVHDRAKELKHPVVGVNVGESPTTDDAKEGFTNLRAELWWNVRERFERGEIDIDPDDDDLASELCDIRYKRLSNGKIQIESKLDAAARGVASPNRADAVMLAFAVLPEEETHFATWGR